MVYLIYDIVIRKHNDHTCAYTITRLFLPPDHAYDHQQWIKTVEQDVRIDYRLSVLDIVDVFYSGDLLTDQEQSKYRTEYLTIVSRY